MQNLNPEMTFGIKIHSMRQAVSITIIIIFNPLNHCVASLNTKQEAKSVNRTEIEAANRRTPFHVSSCMWELISETNGQMTTTTSRQHGTNAGNHLKDHLLSRASRQNCENIFSHDNLYNGKDLLQFQEIEFRKF